MDAEDLAVLSSLVQDAVFPASEMRWDRGKRRFALLLNRVRWEADVSPSGIASLLVDVDYTATSSWAVRRNTRWQVSSTNATAMIAR